jgi:hypothetical protein
MGVDGDGADGAGSAGSVAAAASILAKRRRLIVFVRGIGRIRQ